MMPQRLRDNGGIHPVRKRFLISASALLLLPLLGLTAAAADAGGVWLVLEKISIAREFLETLLQAAYRRQPALVLALSTLLAVPVFAILSLSSLSLARAVAWRRSLRQPSAKPRDIVIRDPRPRTGVPAWPASAWLRMDDGRSSIPIAAEVVSIGRHEDNVLILGDASVHRFHAIIHRGTDAHFNITDISGDTGSGVRVNGERRHHARLVNGDRIELGHTRLTFAAVPH